jgi:hypothetical protein
MHTLAFQFFQRSENRLQILVEHPNQLQPGQLLAFMPACYARIVSIRHSRKRPLGLVTLEIMGHGLPDPSHHQAQVLSTTEQLGIIHQQLGLVDMPITLPVTGEANLTTDVTRYGGLTVVDSSYAPALLKLLPHLISGLAHYTPVIILDPTGITKTLEGLASQAIGAVPATRDETGMEPTQADTPFYQQAAVPPHQLSLAQFGWSHFLDVLAQQLPASLQGQPLEYVMEGLPQQGFVPFYPMLKPVLPSHPMDTAHQQIIQQALQQIRRLNLFADDESQVWQPYSISRPTVIRLNHLPQPWRSAVLAHLISRLQQTGPHTCLLIEPERFLPLEAMAIGAKLDQQLIITTPDPADDWMADNTFTRRANGSWGLNGLLTAHFSVVLDADSMVVATGKRIQPLTDHLLSERPELDQPEIDQPETDQPETDQPETDPPEMLASMPAALTDEPPILDALVAETPVTQAFLADEATDNDDTADALPQPIEAPAAAPVHAEPVPAFMLDPLDRLTDMPSGTDPGLSFSLDWLDEALPGEADHPLPATTPALVDADNTPDNPDLPSLLSPLTLEAWLNNPVMADNGDDYALDNTGVHAEDDRQFELNTQRHIKKNPVFDDWQDEPPAIVETIAETDALPHYTDELPLTTPIATPTVINNRDIRQAQNTATAYEVDDTAVSTRQHSPPTMDSNAPPTLKSPPSGAQHDIDAEDEAMARFIEGDVVRHPKFGRGTVKKVIWMDAEHEVLNVWFDRAGKRLLDPSMAALERVS